MKSTKDTLFFLTPESADEKPKKSERKPPVAPKANGSPVKSKTIGGKVLRNANRRGGNDEVHQTAFARLAEHQRELHEKLQAEGMAKYSEDGGGTGGKEGKGWKKFQSYKGEGALPSEVDRLRVSTRLNSSDFHAQAIDRSLSTVKRKPLYSPSTDTRCPST